MKLKFSNIILIIVLMLIIFVIVSIISFSKFRKELIALKIEEVDLSKVNDGTYMGNCDMKYVTAVVNVTVQNNKITSIDILEHRHGPSKKYGAESIKDKIIEKQSLNVDAISGATGSSKVIRKAVELALKKGIK